MEVRFFDDKICLTYISVGSKDGKPSRPLLQILRRQNDRAGYIASETTHILSLTRSKNRWEQTGRALPFGGRLVEEYVNVPLPRHWFKTCEKKHTQKPQHVDCRPFRRRRIPNFRLVDIQKRCLVLVDSKKKSSVRSMKLRMGERRAPSTQ